MLIKSDLGYVDFECMECGTTHYLFAVGTSVVNCRCGAMIRAEAIVNGTVQLAGLTPERARDVTAEALSRTYCSN